MGVFDNTGTVNDIQYVTISSAGNASDFGDLSDTRRSGAGASSSTRGLIMGGIKSSPVNIIEYITIANTGNMTDFGDLANTNYRHTAVTDSTTAISIGGDGSDNVMEFVTIASTGNASDFGDIICSQGVTDGGPEDAQSTSNCHGGL